MRVRRRRGSATVESALIWPAVVLIAALLFSHGLEETALVRADAEDYGSERASRAFDMPEQALSLSSLPVFSEDFFSDVSE